MKSFKFTLLILLLAVCPRLFQQVQNDDSLFVRTIAENILKSNSCHDKFYFLTKNIGGRLAGSVAMGKSERWAQTELKKAGADTVWLQPCKVTHWERGGQDSVFVSYTGNNGNRFRRRISAAAIGNTIGTGDNGLKTGIVMVNSFEDLEKQGTDVSGRIVFFNPKFRDDQNPIDEYSRLAKYRTAGASAAAKYGARGMILRSLTGSIDDFPHTGVQYYNPGVPMIPAVAVSTEGADFLEKILKGNNKIEGEIYTHGRIFPDTTGYNVIGEVRGWEYPERYITIGAHLDSWDVSEGASDDGTGAVITIELLRVLRESGYRPRHTLRFVLFADEENGLKGGNAYAEMAGNRNEIHVFAMESDSGCFPPYSIGIQGFSPDSFRRLESFSSLFTPYGAGVFTNRGAADISPLNQSFKTPIASLWSDQQKYFRVHHSTNDIYENVDINSIKTGAINFAILLYLTEKYELK